MRRIYTGAAGVLAVCAALGAMQDLRAQSVSPQLFNDLHWRLIGPFRAGRVVAVSGVPGDPNTFYFGSVDGGVWKTTDAGTVWKPIFDHQPVASVGALAVAPSNPKVIYAGTGETDIRSDLASGNGVYKSTDGGQTWANLGLKNTRQISKIVIDPADPETVFVGALGHAFGPSEERGVYKSSDGGKTWKRTLDRGASVGVADLAIAAGRPKLLFASLWNAHRPPWVTYAPIVGEGSGLYRSEDGGESWQQCSGHGLPDGMWGRSGVAVSSDGQRVYALVEATKPGLYASRDGGNNWSLVNADPRLTSRAWYFSRITVDPNDPDTIYMPNVALMGSKDGGKTVYVVRGAPGGDDYHELWVDPKNSASLLLGTDQGTTISPDRGKSWSTWYNQPTAQIYHLDTDNQFPYTVYGSQQDSGGVSVKSRTDHGQITPRDWAPATGSESGYILVDPKDPNVLYASGSYGIVQRFQKDRALSQDITPWPVPIFSTDIAERKYRDSWTPPLAFSPADPGTLYLGAQYVLKTTDAGLHWTVISPDLTGATASAAKDGAFSDPASAASGNTLEDAAKPNGPTVANAIARGYGTLLTVAPSYLNKDVLWTGSDTGVISVTRDGGKSWANVTPPELQPWSRIAQIDPSHFDAGVAYAAVDRHRMDDQTPYIYRTGDYGKSWKRITTGLAAPEFVRVVREDTKQKGLLYAGTEFSVFVSFDDGDRWQPLQLNLPVSSVRDLAVHGDDLVAATHGRSFWILDDITPLRQAAEHAASRTPFLFQPEVTTRVDNDAFPGTPLPPEEPTAENPPAGALLDYYLPVAAREVELRIYTADHKLVRQISSEKEHEPQHALLPIAARWFPEPQRLETEPGMHRFVWNLAWGTSGVAESDEPDDGEGGIPRGPRVAPGTYTVEFAVDGKSLPPAHLVVVMDPRATATQAQLEQQFQSSYGIYQASLASRRALAEMDSVASQLAKVSSGGQGSDAIRNEARQVAAALHAVQKGGEAAPTATSGSQSMGLAQANTELTSALNVSESSERGMPAAASQVFSQADAASTARVGQWDALKKGPLAQLNTKLKAGSLPPINVAEIEREVFYLMTR